VLSNRLPRVRALLVLFGYVKGTFTVKKPLRSAWQTAVVGGLAAAAAFGIAKVDRVGRLRTSIWLRPQFHHAVGLRPKKDGLPTPWEHNSPGDVDDSSLAASL
jgi:hypothetical protein